MPIGPSQIAFILFLAAISASLVACGRRGPLELPPGVAPSCVPLTGTPGDNQAASTAGELPGQTPASTGGESPPQASKACANKPQRSFFLDPLL